ncbi:hypothetical protein [Cohnella thailandensis]|uniref:Uncharacterized protein n=1 Tax=Cohnella thailandensis TaxID=557557 RepID=A0A841T0A4_9BACL|nr:hypothetical protein [Cohnella thailandensis]MBB6636962.1 hypothetical protein [Cohnella thailandensis]MBP1973155.1 chromosome segregation ATPase [Cohnella thailandensis]
MDQARLQLLEWNEQLAACGERRKLKEKRQRRLTELKELIARQGKAVEESRILANEEQSDVETLTKASIPRAWYKLIGQLDERLEQEEKEAAEATLKLDSALTALSALESELAENQRLFAEVAGSDREYEELLEKKKNWIRLFDEPTEKELDRLTEETGALRARLKETKEAETAGSRASDRLSGAQDKLRSARSWGTYDMLGGGMISTAIKHSRIDEAREQMRQAQSSLRSFERELADLDWQSGAGDVELSGFLTFADYFFDGLLMDWVVQGRINEALEKVDSGGEEVNRQLARLAKERTRLESELATLERTYRETIEQR